MPKTEWDGAEDVNVIETLNCNPHYCTFTYKLL